MVYVEHRGEDLPVPFETGTVGDAMSHGVISCPPETPLRVVARMMATHGVHAIFVFEHTEEDDGAAACGRSSPTSISSRPRGSISTR